MRLPFWHELRERTRVSLESDCEPRLSRARAPHSKTMLGHRDKSKRVNVRGRQERRNLREERDAGETFSILRSSVDAWPARLGPTTTAQTVRRANLPRWMCRCWWHANTVCMFNATQTDATAPLRGT
eukprot:6309645-Pyramimonas_sp.AAC.1